jgi:hypothetical protein
MLGLTEDLAKTESVARNAAKRNGSDTGYDAIRVTVRRPTR